MNGKWERASTRCTELADAKQRATELVTEAWSKEWHSLLVVNKRFKSVARLAIRRMENLAKAVQNKATYRTTSKSLITI